MYAILEGRKGFSGDFERLPFEAGTRFGPIPQYPSSAEYQHAVSRAGDLAASGDAAAIYHIVAFKARMKKADANITSRAIYKKVAQRLHRAR